MKVAEKSFVSEQQALIHSNKTSPPECLSKVEIGCFVASILCFVGGVACIVSVFVNSGDSSDRWSQKKSEYSSRCRMRDDCLWNLQWCTFEKE